MPSRHATIPALSLLLQGGTPYDYTDSFEGYVSDPHHSLTPADLGKAFFSSGPVWMDALFRLRNRLVALAGLKTSGRIKNRQVALQQFRCQPGERLGLFRVFYCMDKEVILGEDDRHLDFRVSLFLHPASGSSLRKITISTTVQYHNAFGRLYFLPVKPFHRLIVPALLKGIIRQLEKPRGAV